MFLLLAGCAATGPATVGPDLEPIVVGAELLPVPPRPDPTPPPPAPPREAPRADIALVVDPGAAAHADVADAIEAALPARRYRITRFTTAGQELEALRTRRVTVVAVGPEAVIAARAALPDKPLVFCQVPAYTAALRPGTPTWGVETLPPLSLQLKSWQSLDPSLRTIALIVGASGAALAEQARHAATELAADLLVEKSGSDRETLYIFRRIAPTVDGLWLLPDNDALSPQVLLEMLTLSSTRGIGVLTFNEALLTRGALLTATAVPSDVAETVARIVERVVAGRTADLPAMTPLRAAELAVNVDVAAALGLPPVTVPRWVARDPD
ncbi:MAG TPA: hypothetical protein VFL84_01265 [Gammaproteobacteria bacterium]|nr:hypothetical protein [Gammaproteobacteria bacterium]